MARHNSITNISLSDSIVKEGFTAISTKNDTIIQVKIGGVSGNRLLEALRLADAYVLKKVKAIVDDCIKKGQFFEDSSFGPTSDDIGGVNAMCKNGKKISSTNTSKHQMKILQLTKEEKIRWERPKYASVKASFENNSDNSDQDVDEEEDCSDADDDIEPVFCQEGYLFNRHIDSGNVIQGNLGDCWLLGAASVVATRMDLLEQIFWRQGQFQENGIFVCRFLKDFYWHYVIVDDRLPVFGFSNNRPGKPYFAHSRDPNELWVSIMEKAFAKLNGSYESLIGGYIDVALNSLTGLCSEQIIMKPEHPGFLEDPFAPTKKDEKKGDKFWKLLVSYKKNGCLMGCSIQPDPKNNKAIGLTEASAGQGLNYKHAYGLIDVNEIQTKNGETIRLVKLRNPWGMGEWTGDWCDESQERIENDSIIKETFAVIKGREELGRNASLKIHEEVEHHGELTSKTCCQTENIEMNRNDGTFFMSFIDWMDRFTHFFAGIDFLDDWCGFRVQGTWDEQNSGGNPTKKTWIDNPKFKLSLKEQSQVFISLSQHDPRGEEDDVHIFPICFHICSYMETADGYTLREPSKKSPPYYRLYSEDEKKDFSEGLRQETVPPAIIPGSVIPDVDFDGQPQPKYTFKQSVSLAVTMEAGDYCIVPSCFLRQDKETGKTNIGSFWISVYSDKHSIRLEKGELIAEEEEGDEWKSQISGTPIKNANFPSSPDTVSLTSSQENKRFEDVKDRLMSQALKKSIGYRQVKAEFSDFLPVTKPQLKRKLLNVGFSLAELTDDILSILFTGIDYDKSGTISATEILKFFLDEMEEDRILAQKFPKEEDDLIENIYEEGILNISVIEGKDLVSSIQNDLSSCKGWINYNKLEYSNHEKRQREELIEEIFDDYPELEKRLHFLKRKTQKNQMEDNQERRIKKERETKQERRNSVQGKMINVEDNSHPVDTFYKLLEEKIKLKKEAKEKVKEENDRINETFKTVQVVTSSITVVPPKDQPTTLDSSIHQTERMRNLEEKRTMNFLRLKKEKIESMGNKEKLRKLPRFVGGRKSAFQVKCIDCNLEVGDNMEERECKGRGCIHVFCTKCWLHLRQERKFCEDCFLHEQVQISVIGIQLKTMMMQKIGSSEYQLDKLKEEFNKLDKDKSGDLSRLEFVSVLKNLGIDPPLTEEQITEFIDQFDLNKDGVISFDEFKSWLDHSAWSPSSLIDQEKLDESLDTKMADEFKAELMDEFIVDLISRVDQVSNIRLQRKETIHFNNLTDDDSITMNTDFKEEELLVFKRMLSIDTNNSYQDIQTLPLNHHLVKYDLNQDKTIPLNDLFNLIKELGCYLKDVKSLKLLIERCNIKNNSKSDRINLTEFLTCLRMTNPLMNSLSTENNTQISMESISDVLIRLLDASGSLKSIPEKKNCFTCLQGLRQDLLDKDLLSLSDKILDESKVLITIEQMQRLAMIFSPVLLNKIQTTKEEDEVSFCSAGTELITFLQSNTEKDLRELPFDNICSLIRKVVFQGNEVIQDDLLSLWNGLICGRQELPQVEFIHYIISQYSLSLTTETSLYVNPSIPLSIQIGLFIDAIRCQIECDEARSNNLISFKLFQFIIEQNSLNDLHKKIIQLVDYHENKQNIYLVTIGIAKEESRLIIRAIDIIEKKEMNVCLKDNDIKDFIIPSNRLKASNEVKKSKEQQEEGLSKTKYGFRKNSRESNFLLNPYALITNSCYPREEDALLQLCNRLRLVYGVNSSLHLIIVENPLFLSTLKQILDLVNLPVFYRVSSYELSFYVNPLMSTSQGIKEHVIKLIFQHSQLYLFLLHSRSTLNVSFHIIGEEKEEEVLPWKEFIAYLQGLRNAYAHIELLPYGNSFLTRVDYKGGCNPSWLHEENIEIQLPKDCTERTDRPVVFMDIRQIKGIPDDYGQSNVHFLISDYNSITNTTKNLSSTSLTTSTTLATTNLTTTFVLLSVRKSLPKGNQLPYLYITAYDPTTACDYKVNGYPDNWNISFFDEKQGNSTRIQQEWEKIVPLLTLGKVITPKLNIKVYNKLKNNDQFIGQCEIPVLPVLTSKGSIVKGWYPLYKSSITKENHPLGQIHFQLQFQSKTITCSDTLTIKKVDEIAKKSNETMNINIISLERKNSSKEEEKLLLEKKISNLLVKVNESTKECLEAKDKILQLEEQLNSKVNTTKNNNNLMENDMSKWERKYQRLEALNTQQKQEYEKKVIELQRKLAQEKEQEIEEQLEKYSREMKNRNKEIKATNEQSIQQRLGDNASAHDTLQAIKDILSQRCPKRPFNALKKALAAVADGPDKVSFSALIDVLQDFGMDLTQTQQMNLNAGLDETVPGYLSIEDFLIKLCGDADVHGKICRTETPTKKAASRGVAAMVESSNAPASIPENKGTSENRNPSPSISKAKITKEYLEKKLPSGWEIRFTENGRPYYCDHRTRTTQWKHPDPQVAELYQQSEQQKSIRKQAK